MLVPVMPTLRLAVLVLLARFSISQMDVPTRQSYLMAVVPPEERSAAAEPVQKCANWRACLIQVQCEQRQLRRGCTHLKLVGHVAAARFRNER